MADYDDLDSYNGDPVHDGWIDFDYNENTGELSGLFEDTDINDFIDNLNDWDYNLLILFKIIISYAYRKIYKI